MRAPENRELDIMSDSKHVITEATKYLQKHEDEGYIGKENTPIIRSMIATLRKRSPQTRLRWIKGHNGHKLNEGADRLAGEGAHKPDQDEVNIDIPHTLQLTGAKLSTLTQKLAYKGIRQHEMTTYKKRTRTQNNLIKIADYIENHYKTTPSEESIWRNIRHKDLRREIKYFLWMATHDAYMVGSNWLRTGYSDEMKARHECQTCGVEESMEHILTECEAPGQTEIWNLAEQLWRKKRDEWNNPLLGGILGCAGAMFKTEKGAQIKGTARLHRIIISESAHLIWKLRNERIIRFDNGRQHTQAEIRNKWTHAMNDRLAMDCHLTNKKKYGKKAIKPKLVEETWSGVLKNENQLPHDWTKGKVEVLVGIEFT
ncbi:uncharacterized protein B0H18DRAFT_1086704 [Fomitopsis serialis]|uniref:uncharacterized protein n=1 Tax=Fomitopsis serialis TaxID=139415 RepID=UPI0020084A79|nr:uncharacterized protein B0H18DRAFT_1086704 [Neoantrodia serialis]KAH9919254.1 hypothetical protein B0H18DRAFT_1086704 [Neoantrodia serialis]